MKRAYEYIVVGCGGIGSATVYWLSRAAGNGVLGIEQFRLGHDNGGSQDHSRIIRLSYHAPEYARLTPHTYSAWHEVEAESGIQLVFKIGGLDLGPAEGDGHKAVADYAEAMTAADIPFEALTAKEAMYRWPQFRLPDSVRALYQADSGIVDARKANATHVALARTRGATILENTPVQNIRPVGDGVEVDTTAGTFSARRLVITGGAWTNSLLSHVGIQWRITVTQEQVSYFQTPHVRAFAPDCFPIWIWHGGKRNCFYGFPVYGEVATKAGEDVGGQVVTPETRTFEVDRRADESLKRFLATYIPDSLGPVLYTKSCLYDMPPDRNFIIDTLPEYPQIAVANGAAHAFKFAGLIGRILSQLVVEGASSYPIEAFRINRPALTDPNYPLEFMI